MLISFPRGRDSPPSNIQNIFWRFLPSLKLGTFDVHSLSNRLSRQWLCIHYTLTHNIWIQTQINSITKLYRTRGRLRWTGTTHSCYSRSLHNPEAGFHLKPRSTSRFWKSTSLTFRCSTARYRIIQHTGPYYCPNHWARGSSYFMLFSFNLSRLSPISIRANCSDTRLRDYQ